MPRCRWAGTIRACTIDATVINNAEAPGRAGWRDVKRALLTGVTGQDGAYLPKLLLEEGYEAFGLVRRSASPDSCLGWLGILDRVQLVRGDLADLSRLINLMREIRPQEV